MDYKIDYTLKDDILKKLKCWKNRFIECAYIDIFSSYQAPNYDMVTHLLFGAEKKKEFLCLRNIVHDEEQDHDEYSAFDVNIVDNSIFDKKYYILKKEKSGLVFDKTEQYRWHIFDIHEQIKQISIYQDSACWLYKGNNWNVVNDVAICFRFSQYSILAVLHDSIDEMFSVHYKYDQNENDLISKYWSEVHWGMKCENMALLEKAILKRNVIII